MPAASPRPVGRADTRRLQGRRRHRSSHRLYYGREKKADADIAKTLTMDKSRRVAANIAKLPELLSSKP